MTTDRAVTDELHMLLADAEAGVEPAGEIQQGQVINKPSAGDDLPMAVSELRSAGYTYVYDIRNGDRSLVNNNMLARQLEKKDPETGARVFTTRDPGYRPVAGTSVCWLHESHEYRKYADEFGLPKCRKHNIPSTFQAREHTRKRHPQEYAAINDAVRRDQEAEDRRVQRQLLEQALGRNADPAPATVAVAPDEPEEASKPDEPRVRICTVCGEEITATTKTMGVTMARHNKTHKEDV